MSDLTPDDYGIIGNRFGAALVNRMGSIDWCCMPYLDSPSHFSAMIDENQGGRFQIMPQGEFRSEQHYLLRTQALETFFETPLGRARLTDWMPAEEDSNFEAFSLCRRIEVIQGKVSWILICMPRFRYGSDLAQAEKNPRGILFRGPHFEDLALLQTEIPLEISANGTSAVARFTLEAGQVCQFVWAWGRESTIIKMPRLQPTLEYWRKVAHQCATAGTTTGPSVGTSAGTSAGALTRASTSCIFGGPWHEAITRSGLILKLLISPYSGSVAESLAVFVKGQVPQGQRWGHRYASIRDGALILQALVHLGYWEEARSYFNWIKGLVERDGALGLQSLYTLDGGKILPERESLSFNENENEKLKHFQLDIYGHVVVTASEYYKIFGELPEDFWPALCEIADYICQAWRRPDFGPWGHGHKSEHYLVSKLFCWAALDQACWLARQLKLPPSTRWATEKSILHRTICTQGFDVTQDSFVQAFGSRDIDSSCLWILLLNFLPMDDPRIYGTLNAVRTRLSNGVLLRKNEASFEMNRSTELDLWSSFLFISCLALTDQVDEASDRLAEICSYASSLGIFGDQMQPNAGEFAQNFPSALVHFSLINATLYVGWAKGRQKSLLPLLGSYDYPEKEIA